MRRLTAEMIEAFSGVYLSPRYDSPQPTPPFHRQCWARYCSDDPACATAAPRNHAKSTALTHDYALATVLFRDESYVILVGSSEEMAIEHLGDIANELRENDDLIRDFQIKGFIVEQKTDIVVECADGHQFRIIARGAEQKIRGRKWRGQRPGLIICDDLEDDEQVVNRDRRRKFSHWFFRACKQALRDGGRIRVHGTILHEDSLLNHLIKNKAWNSQLYRAHKAFSDFSEILWPEKFPEKRLRSIRQEFINEGDSAGYAQEYLNSPFDFEGAFLRKDDFIAMSREGDDNDYDRFKRYAVGVDFAISKADTANRTAFVVGGKDSGNLIHITDVRVGRWDSLEIIDMFFEVYLRWKPDMFFVEKGAIWNAIYPSLRSEMFERDVFLPITGITPVKDKKARGRPFQKRARSGAMRYDKEASWYEEYEEELLRFTGDSEALLDDQFDATGLTVVGIESFDEVDDEEREDEISEEEMANIRESQRYRNEGRSSSTGY